MQENPRFQPWRSKNRAPTQSSARRRPRLPRLNHHRHLPDQVEVRSRVPRKEELADRKVGGPRSQFSYLMMTRRTSR